MTQYSEKDLIKLAEDIYSLDERTYMLLGSALGRVFNIGKTRSIQEMVTMMKSGKGYVLRNEMALISNMARTIPNREAKEKIMMEYEGLLKKVMNLPTNQMSVDILDEETAKLKQITLKHRFDEEDRFIICIERTYGCGGTGIGFELADALGINYYDDEIFDEVMKRLEAEKSHAFDYGGFSYNKEESGDVMNYIYTEPAFVSDEKQTFHQRLKDFSRYHGLPRRDAIFFNQSHLLKDMAKSEDFVIMGHCADVILTKNRIPHISILLTAPMELRVKRIQKVNPNMTEKQIRALVKQQDASYSRYYKFFTDLDWQDPSHYDISINCAAYGVQGSTNMILHMLKRNFK
jgi:cytidylate kinase